MTTPPKSKEPEPDIAVVDDRAAETKSESSKTADTGKIAAQPILVASPKHMAKYEHSPHSGTDQKYQRSPQNQMPALAAPQAHTVYQPAPYSKPEGAFEDNGFLHALDYLRDNIMEASAENQGLKEYVSGLKDFISQMQG